MGKKVECTYIPKTPTWEDIEKAHARVLHDLNMLKMSYAQLDEQFQLYKKRVIEKDEFEKFKKQILSVYRDVMCCDNVGLNGDYLVFDNTDKGLDLRMWYDEAKKNESR